MPLNQDKILYINRTMVKQYFLYNHTISFEKKNRTFTKNIVIFPMRKIHIKSNTTQAESFTRAIYYNSLENCCPHYIIDDICSWQLLEDDIVGYVNLDKGKENCIFIIMIGDSDKVLKNTKQLINHLSQKFNLTQSNIKLYDDYYEKKYIISTQFKNKHNDFFNEIINEEKKVISQKIKEKTDFSDVLSLSTNASNKTKKSDIEIIGQVYDTSWLSEIKEKNNITLSSTKKLFPIKAIALKTSKGLLQYRVHLLGGGWLNWIKDYNLLNWYTGYAGIKNFNIDGIQMQLTGIDDYIVKYRIIGKNKSTDWIDKTYQYAILPNETINQIEIVIEHIEGNI